MARVRAAYFIFLAGYFALVLAAGLLFKRRMRNLEDFFLASRSLPPSLIYFSLTASWFGATSILVSTDEAYRSGLAAFWIVGVPAVATVLFLAVVLAGPLRRLPIMTIPDLVEIRYGRAVRHLASLLIIWYMVLLAASQMVALGLFLKTFLGLSYVSCLALGTAVVLIYSTSGGLRSVVFTDVVQFILLTAGVAAVAAFVWSRTSLPDLARLVSDSGKSGYLSLFHNFKENALIAVSFTLAWTISPIALQRIQSARDVRAARTGLFATAGTLVLLYGGVILIGIFSFPFFSGRDLPGPLISEIIASRLGLVFGGFIFVAVLAAILSTMDTAVNTGALSVTRDVVQQFVPLAASRALFVSRLSTLLVGALAFLVATRFQSILKTIGLASELMAEGLFVPGLAMIFMKKRVPLAGLLSLTLGGGFAVLSFLAAAKVVPAVLPAWPYSLPWGLALSLMGFGAGLWLERAKRRRRLD